MKDIKKYRKYVVGILVLALCIISINGCKTDELELTNPNELSPETFFKNEAQLQSAVNAVYANLQTRGLWVRHMFFMMDNMSHENAGNPQLEADKQQYLDFSFDASHGAIGAYWESCYRGINKANYVISNEEIIDEIQNLPDATKNKFIGEARFLRAFYYFLLVTRFGDIPLVTTASEDGQGLPRTSKDQIYDEVIIPDLEAAASSLMEKGEAEQGRATVGAAYALLGKVHLYRGDYGLAQDAFNEIMDDYSLVDDYRDNFMEETEHNDESIFEIEFDVSLGHGAKWNSDRTGAGLNEITFRGQEYGWNDWFNVYPSDDLINEYEDDDPRYEDNFYSNGDSFNEGESVVELPLDRVAGWKKYQNYYKRANENTDSGINFRVIRYADVLLMMAEIENEIGTQSQAVNYLNMIRDRVGMPNYGTPEMDATYPVSTKDEVFAAIVHERKVELAGEQVRFPDLVRWGMGDQIPNFEVGKHELFPIPLIEINANEQITNADQNPGY